MPQDEFRITNLPEAWWGYVIWMETLVAELAAYLNGKGSLASVVEALTVVKTYEVYLARTPEEAR